MEGTQSFRGKGELHPLEKHEQMMMATEILEMK